MNVCGRSRFFGGEAAFAGCFENAGIGIPLRLLSTTSAWTEYLREVVGKVEVGEDGFDIAVEI